MQGDMRPLSPASTVFESDDEINNTSGHPIPPSARRNSSVTTLAEFVESHERASRTIILCLEGSDQRFGVDYAKDFISLLERDNPEQEVYYYHPREGKYVRTFHLPFI